MTYFLGLNGAIYADYGTTTITFDSKGGSTVAPITQKIRSAVSAPASPTLEGKTFGGWFYNEAFTAEWDAYGTVMPAKDITLYAKWNDAGSTEEQLAWYKQKAQAALEKQYNKYASSDYTAENWSALQSAYISGISAINNAEAGTAHIEDNVTAALNAAIAAMQAIPAKDTSKATVAVSMDANALGLGYLLEPTLVTVDKGTPVSVVITDLLSTQAAEKYGITQAGSTQKINAESMSTLYPWVSDGAPTAGFYLAQVYFPEQTGYDVPQIILDNAANFNSSDASGKYLGEFDYLTTSGWVYSVGSSGSGEKAEFPGVGANGWSLSDGEVVRWQFTLVGYGADLGADNTAWGTENIVTVGDKTDLTWKVAELRSQFSDSTLKTYDVYNNALAVLTAPEATDAEIAAALAALNGATFVEPVTGVTLDRSEGTIGIRDTLTLTATVSPENATDKTVTWESSDDNTAMVVDGVVTGVKAGTVTITAKAGSFSATCAITVEENVVAVTGISLDKAEAEIETGKTLTLTATVSPEDATDKTVIWESSDDGTATVVDGVVTGVKAGTVTITATAGNYSATCAITVKDPVIAVTGIALDETEAEIEEGKTLALTATVTPENATDKSVTWSTSDADTATVDENGVVTGVKAGTVTITAKAGDKSAACAVTVKAAEKPLEPWQKAENAVQSYVKSKVSQPTVGSTMGEWAVFALNRGGVATESWNETYLGNLMAYVEESNGKLTSKEYTEYSRIILALTSMGIDATQLKVGDKSYDLVKPLLDKQGNGQYWAEWQGNNGTMFALLAVDSHGYLDTAEGKALRAGLIASLKANQMESGAWSISGKTSADIDITAAGVFALAPYYLNEAKLTALGGSVTYAEVKTMVEGALTWLSQKQNSKGGFGSAEADVWVLIALASLGRDADTDAAFVKAEGSLLADLLTYYDEESGGFRHLLTEGVDQLASEQAAYGLAAYERLKNSKNTLYDMSDVTLNTNTGSETGSGSGEDGGSGSGGSGSGDSTKKITVTMRLIGAELATKDVDLSEEAYLPNYVTWIDQLEN